MKLVYHSPSFSLSWSLSLHLLPHIPSLPFSPYPLKILLYPSHTWKVSLQSHKLSPSPLQMKDLFLMSHHCSEWLVCCEFPSRAHNYQDHLAWPLVNMHALTCMPWDTWAPRVSGALLMRFTIPQPLARSKLLPLADGPPVQLAGECLSATMSHVTCTFVLECSVTLQAHDTALFCVCILPPIISVCNKLIVYFAPARD